VEKKKIVPDLEKVAALWQTDKLPEAASRPLFLIFYDFNGFFVPGTDVPVVKIYSYVVLEALEPERTGQDG